MGAVGPVAVVDDVRGDEQATRFRRREFLQSWTKAWMGPCWRGSEAVSASTVFRISSRRGRRHFAARRMDRYVLSEASDADIERIAEYSITR